MILGMKSKDMNELIRMARLEGWVVEVTGGGHLRFAPPAGRPLFTSSTPGDKRSIDNFKSRLRRAGLDVPHKSGA